MNGVYIKKRLDKIDKIYFVLENIKDFSYLNHDVTIYIVINLDKIIQYSFVVFQIRV